MELHQPDLASAFELWTVGRRGELFNTGKDTLRSARYCYFDLRDLEGEPELMTAIVYVIFSKVYRDIADETSPLHPEDGSFSMKLTDTSPTRPSHTGSRFSPGLAGTGTSCWT